MITEYTRTKEYDWNECLSCGKESEKNFYEYFHNVRGLELEFVDRKDCDFEVVDKKGNICEVDVKKADIIGKYAYSRQRLCIENVQNTRINSDGWYKYDTNDRLIIAHDECINKIFYMYMIGDLREYINTYYEQGRDNGRVLYYTLRQSECYGVYLEKFFIWLQENKKFNKKFNYNVK